MSYEHAELLGSLIHFTVLISSHVVSWSMIITSRQVECFVHTLSLSWSNYYNELRTYVHAE